MEKFGSPVPIRDDVSYSNRLSRRSNPARVDFVKNCAQDFPKLSWLDEPHPFDLLIFNWSPSLNYEGEGCGLAQWVPSWSFHLP